MFNFITGTMATDCIIWLVVNKNDLTNFIKMKVSCAKW